MQTHFFHQTLFHWPLTTSRTEIRHVVWCYFCVCVVTIGFISASLNTVWCLFIYEKKNWIKMMKILVEHRSSQLEIHKNRCVFISILCHWARRPCFESNNKKKRTMALKKQQHQHIASNKRKHKRTLVIKCEMWLFKCINGKEIRLFKCLSSRRSSFSCTSWHELMTIWL